jgi:magnesium transporter
MPAHRGNAAEVGAAPAADAGRSVILALRAAGHHRGRLLPRSGRPHRLHRRVYDDSATLDIKPALGLKKHALLLRQTLSPIRDLLNQFLRTDQPLIAPVTRVYYLDVYDHALRLVEQVDLQRDMLSGTLEAVMAQTSNRLNKVMKTMTGISTILMSAALIAGVYGMNFDNMPELHTRYGYFLTLGGMAAVCLGLAMFFRRIKWF